ncbi:Hypothetical predicted protein, partial [Pelobates cultripes]
PIRPNKTLTQHHDDGANGLMQFFQATKQTRQRRRSAAYRTTSALNIEALFGGPHEDRDYPVYSPPDTPTMGRRTPKPTASINTS